MPRLTLRRVALCVFEHIRIIRLSSSPPPRSTLVSLLFAVTVTVTRQLSRLGQRSSDARADSHLPSNHRHLHDATVYPSRRLPRELIIINHVNFTITGCILPAAPFAFYAVQSRREKVWQSKTFRVLTRLMSTTGIIRSADFMSIIRCGREL